MSAQVTTVPSAIDQTLASSRFWPSVRVRDWVEGYRISADSRDMALVMRLVEAISKVNDTLRPVRTAAKAAGFQSLQAWAEAQTDAEDDLINGEPAVIHAYRAAVGSWAKARTLAMQAATSKNPTRATAEIAEATETVDWWERRYQEAIALITRRVLPDNPMPEDAGLYVASLGPSA